MNALVWFRRDLRADDHAALYHALRRHERVYCAFVLDTEILDALPRADRRVAFILDALRALDAELAALAPGAGLIVRHGAAQAEIPALAAALGVDALYFNHDDEPAALRRDAAVGEALIARGVQVESFKDHVVFERSEILTGSGKPYGVFTPYKNAWLREITPFFLSSYPVQRHAARLADLTALANRAGIAPRAIPSLGDIGFEPAGLSAALTGGSAGARRLLTSSSSASTATPTRATSRRRRARAI